VDENGSKEGPDENGVKQPVAVVEEAADPVAASHQVNDVPSND